MRLSNTEKQYIADILTPYQKNKYIQSLKHNNHHGKVTTYEHCDHVVRVSYWMNKHLHLHAKEEVLLVSAFLHDFYLYDWHVKDPSHRLHVFHHPAVACKNAVANFQIGPREQRIIRTHMWPVTPIRIPTSREAWIVTLADKYCTIVEVIKNKLQR